MKAGDEEKDENMVQIQVNIDDMNPELFPYLFEQLLSAGANDVYIVPIIMKKGRPGNLLNVLTSSEKLNAMEEIIFSQSTSFGLRYSQVICHRLAREFKKVETQWGKVQVKIGSYRGQIMQISPEFEDCKKIAQRANIPLKSVYEMVRKNFK